jgi:Glycoside hydrolase family 44
MGLNTLKALAWFFLGCTLATSTFAQTNQAVYTDSLQNGWVSWGWATSINFSNTSVVHSNSSRSISVSGAGDQALYLHHDVWASTAFTNISFYINGGSSGGQRLRLQATLNGSAQAGYDFGPLLANSWQLISVSLQTLGVAGNPSFDGFWIQDTSGSAFPTFYVDDIVLKAGDPLPPPPQVPAGTNFVTIDVAANRHSISPEIYGVAFASTAELQDLNSPLNRSGGNTTSRYNWQVNADNRANDYYFESIGSSSATPGEAGDTFISNSKAAGAQPMLTIPMLDWIAKLGPSRSKLASFSVSKYGAQQYTDPYMSDAGNGVKTDGSTFVTGNDPNDANTPSTSALQQTWVQHLTNTWHTATNGGLRYYLLDNEPSIWHSTHRDVHPTGATMEELRNKMIDYANKIKAVDPNAIIFGPEEWGWSGYFYSGYDQQVLGTNGYSYAPDKAAHANKDYLPWLLDQLRQTNNATGKRLLDVFSVHYYPQGGEFNNNGSDVSVSMQQLRNKSTRALWDTNYVDPTWINDKVQLIPRLKNWVATYYPGCRTAITEYNWGAEDYMNGATCQADILGIFGREGLDFATRWTTPAGTTPTYKAIKMYRNYDGNKSVFGDISVLANATNVDNVAVFAAQRTNDGALTIMVINKYLSNSAPVSLRLSNFGTNGSAQVWQLNTNVISHLPDLAYTNSTLNATLPIQSVTLFVLPVTANATLQASRAGGQVDLLLNGQIGATYILQSTTNLTNWSNLSTNSLASSQQHFLQPATNAKIFYRAMKTP